jgi:hypothetical protein
MTDTTNYTMKNFNTDINNIKNNMNKRIEYIKRATIFSMQHSMQGQHTPLTTLINTLTLRDKQALNVLLNESTYLKIKCKKSKNGNNVYQVVNTESTISDSESIAMLHDVEWHAMYDITKQNVKKDFTTESAINQIKALINKCNKNGIDFDSVLNEYRHKQQA